MRVLYSLVVLMFAADLSAQTIVSGNVTGTWTVENSPYIVEGDIFIIDSLIIQAGVNVKFQAGGLGIRAGYYGGSHGKLKARGTQDNPIIFETFQGQSPGLWRGIEIINPIANDTLEYCTIRYAQNGVSVRAEYNSPRPPTTLVDCSIYNNSENGVYVDVFCGCATAAAITVNMNHCHIYYNLKDGVCIDDDAIGSANANANLTNCTIYGNAENGINLRAGNTHLKVFNCTIYNNSQNGLKASADAFVSNTIIAYSGEYGAKNENSTPSFATSDIIYNCFWQNSLADFWNISGTDFGLPPCCVNANGDSCDINFNIYFDPLFVDAATADFHLQTNSKCINAGTPIINGQYVLDPDSTFPEIGAFWFQSPTAIEDDFTEMPKNYKLSQNYPNPFNSSTVMKFSLGETQQVKLLIYNILGEKVAELLNKELKMGYHEVKFDAGELSSGVYIYRLEAGRFVKSKKMLLLK